MIRDEVAAKASQLVVQKLKDTGINFLALDFDLTVLDIHTGVSLTETCGGVDS